MIDAHGMVGPKGVNMLGWHVIPYFTYTSPSRDKCLLLYYVYLYYMLILVHCAFFGFSPMCFVCTLNRIPGSMGHFGYYYYYFFLGQVTMLVR